MTTPTAVSGVVKPFRFVWRRLTSMRTALILLFLLAVAAVPGSLLPQRPLGVQKVTAYIQAHGAWGRFLNDLGMYDVFGSVWFAAIYLLLFVSLVGCLVPRIRVHARALARKPLPAPRNLSRLPESGRIETRASAEEYAVRARTVLGRRWRITQRVEDSGAITVSAEKGYSRETGNLLFHVALLASLILIAVGRLYTYEGQKIIIQGQGGFCSNVGNYDTWTPGRFAAEGKVKPAPFCIDRLNSFLATYTSDGEPTQYRADVTYVDNGTIPDSPVKHATIEVNHPLRIDGDRLYLVNHGFAPRITVTMPDGTTRTTTAAFLPSDATTYYSEGVYKIDGRSGADQDVGISGFFAPTPLETSPGVYTSTSPQVHRPLLGLIVYTGDLSNNGLPQSVYKLDTAGLKRVGMANLHVGATKSFADGVRVTFDGWVPWVNLQVSHDPAQGYLLWSALAMVVGLGASLGVRRRRLWLRIAPAGAPTAKSPTVVEVGGLARSDSGNFTAEFEGLLEKLTLAGAADTEPASGGTAEQLDEPVDSIGAGKD